MDYESAVILHPTFLPDPTHIVRSAIRRARERSEGVVAQARAKALDMIAELNGLARERLSLREDKAARGSTIVVLLLDGEPTESLKLPEFG